MNQPLLSQAIANAFPNLDQVLKTEIYEKVTAHLFELLREKVYANDAEGLAKLTQITGQEPNIENRSKAYGKRIIEKLISLPADEQKEIDHYLDEELTRVMHEIYKAYE